MLRNLFRRQSRNDENNTSEPKKLGWSERFFIFAAVMFLLGWASTGIMSNAENLFDFGSEESQQQRLPQQIQISSNLPDDSINITSTSLDNNGSNLLPSFEDITAAQIDNATDPDSDDDQKVDSNDTKPLVSNPVNWGEWYCANCVAVPVNVKLTHYWPPLGGDNCWTFYDDYCYSPTKSTVPWEAVIEIAAACPVPWLGSVVEIPELERRYLCLDTGDKVVCKDGTCVVDVLTDKIYPWDGLEFDAIVYYPKVWVEPAPTFTPVVTPDQ